MTCLRGLNCVGGWVLSRLCFDKCKFETVTRWAKWWSVESGVWGTLGSDCGTRMATAERDNVYIDEFFVELARIRSSPTTG